MEELLEAIERAIENLENNKEQCQRAIQEMKGKWIKENGKLVKSKELLEYENDLEKINKELEEVKKEKEAVKELSKQKESEKFSKKEESLLKDKKQCEKAIQEIQARGIKSKELLKYENDLQKINKELAEVNKEKITQKEKTINELKKKYKIKEEPNPNKNPEDRKDFQPPAVVELDRDPERPNRGLEDRKDFQPPAVVEPDRDPERPNRGLEDREDYQPSAVVEPERVAIAKTGLQIFRQQFNEMPEILKRHNFSENPLLPLPGSVALALATVGVISGPVGWIGATGVAALSYVGIKPILRKVTGQSKLEKEITEQFNEMDVKDLKLMADYLTEEKIIELKPNSVILRALNKSLRQLANRENGKLQEEIEEATSERDFLLSKDTLTKNEEDRLGELSEKIENNRKDMQDNELRTKNAKRGRDRISAEYKGNIKGNRILNIFHKRNSTTQEYKKALNEYANAEVNKLGAEAMNDKEGIARAQAEMEQVEGKYTYTNAIGLQIGQFNMSQAPVVVSDQKDNTVRNIGILMNVAAATMRTVEEMMNKVALVEKGNSILMEEAQKVNGNADMIENLQIKHNSAYNNISDLEMDGAQMDISSGIYNEAEVAAMREHGTVSYLNQEYVKDDQLAQDLGDKFAENLNSSKITEKGVEGRLLDMSEALKGEESLQTAQNLQETSENAQRISGAGVDHTTQFNIQENSVEHRLSHANLVEKLANLVEKGKTLANAQVYRMNPVLQEVRANFIGPIAAATTSLLGTIGVDVKKNIEQAKEMQEER